MLKENNKFLSTISSLMICSAILVPMALHNNRPVHADTAYNSISKAKMSSHPQSLSNKQKLVLTLQQKVNSYQHRNTQNPQYKEYIPNFTKGHHGTLQHRITKNVTAYQDNSQFTNPNVVSNEHPTQKDRDEIKSLNNKAIGLLSKENQNQQKQVSALIKSNQQTQNKIMSALHKNTKTNAKRSIKNPMLQTHKQKNVIRHNLKKNHARYKNRVRMTRSVSPKRNFNQIRPYKNFDKSVLRYKPYLNKVCRYYHMRKYENLLLAIMENESHGHGKDVMQDSASVGKKPNSLKPQQSIEQAVIYLKSITNQTGAMDRYEHRNKYIKPKNYHYYSDDYRLLAQTYNYGPQFLNYVMRSGKGYSNDLSQKYSHNVIAPQFGNKKGKTYPYYSDISKMYHKPFLYLDGGNFFYGDLVNQYLPDGTMMQPILHNLIQYAGNPYVYGGNNPKNGFDCSGLVQYGIKKSYGINIPRTTENQWKYTKPVRNLNQVRSGDLIFFKGTYGGRNHLSHVGFLVNKDTMLDANSNGIRFDNININYWQHHFAGVRRLPQAHKLDLKVVHKMNRQAQRIK